MLEDKHLKYRELRKLLSRHNIYEVKHRGKGSHRLFVGVVEARKISYPVACHSEGQESALILSAESGKLLKFLLKIFIKNRKVCQEIAT